MKIKKLLTYLSLILMSSVAFVGCANIEFIRAIDSTNTIVDKLIIELDESKINKCGRTLAEVHDAIEDDMNNFRNKVNDWKEQFIVYPEFYANLQNGIVAEVASPTKKQISISVQFANWQMFGYFYGKVEDEELEYTTIVADVGPFIDKILNDEYSPIEKGFFFNKYSTVKDTGIVQDLETFSIGSINYKDKYTALLNNWYSVEDIDVTEIFVYPDDRLYSNADYSAVEHDLTMLKWDFSNKKDDFEMAIYKLIPNTITWYVIALVVSTVFVIVATIVIYKRSRRDIQVKITKQEVESNE